MIWHKCHVPEPILACLPDIGTVVAHSIAQFFAQTEQQQMIDDLLANGVCPQPQVPTLPLTQYITAPRWLSRLPDFKISETKAAALWDLAGQKYRPSAYRCCPALRLAGLA